MAQVVDDSLEAGREAARRHAWAEAFELLSAADAESSLDPGDLDLLAEAASWIGRLNESTQAYERAYAGYVDAGDVRRAAYTAMTLVANYRNKGANAIAAGWHSRAARLLESVPESVEHGYLAHQRALMALGRGELDEAFEEAQRAVQIATTFGDRSLEALGLLRQGIVLIKKGDLDEGLTLVDEASAAAVGGQLDPLSTGMIYCATIDACRELGDYARAQEWTDTASRWCERESISGFPGICRVDRAEIMRIMGHLDEAERQATQACEELQTFAPRIAGAAFAEVGETRLRRGDLAQAAEAFRRADELGRAPQPGLALLRLAEGKVEAAVASISRALDEQEWNRLARARLLPAQVEISITAGDVDRAAAAADELKEIAQTYPTTTLQASATSARGAVQLAQGDPPAALQSLRQARRLWQDEVCAPYEAARARVLMGQAYRALADEDAATAEFEAAKASFEKLGAVLDVQRVAELLGEFSPQRTFMFTDIVGSTRIAGALGEDKWRKLLGWHDRTLRELIEANGGEVVKNTGDGFFAAFERPGAAADAAVAIQRALYGYDGVAPDVRIGLHVGTAFEREGEDLGGEAVHAAARIAALGGPGDILGSRETFADGASRFRLSDPRSVDLKGVSQPVEVVSIDWR
ncbi:MAG TPA: adenylate/guanylate cyclase domain-containing protein [Gaiellaceae bacterium]|nr:adenylate/guanylate cyclase domain-containing protein [Gaiellaceae bacterium]